ncbi:MAG: hypothetical protein JXR70_15860 [Spirochaetales bacterium]|nr:hypothetical protein [Spirochaetales bacterium]
MIMLENLSTGIPSLDETLQGIVAGDNIVLQTDKIEDFLPFVHRYCRYIGETRKRIVYFRFADHPPFIPEGVEAEYHRLDPAEGFENFIAEIFRVIEKHGKGGYYLFDCLSGLAVDWYSDRMLGNFFMLACPYLYVYETVTYFVLLRNLHTPLALNAIHNTAQVVLDIYSRKNRIYVQPLKVQDRSSRTLYMLHRWEEGMFQPVTRSTEIAEILSDIPQPWLDVNVDRRDPWTKTFITARAVRDAIEAGREPQEDPQKLKTLLIRMILTRESSLFDLCSSYFEIDDLLAIGKRMIGTGLIGGKSVGMLLARKIIHKNDPDLYARLETHDSYYIGADVFYSYVVLNGIWHDRYKMKRSKNMYEKAEVMGEKLLKGEFPPEIIAQFREVLNYFGQSPLIVRSSSLLEDAYGNSFSGKYESVFCANQGNPEERLAFFLDAVRTIYASTASKEALSYRALRGLLGHDEQMALLVQRVSGGFYGKGYFPHVGGVGYSFNPYVWNSRIDPKAGMLRLVFGLGTRAVDRHDDDYTRIIALNEPGLRPEGSAGEMRAYSQRIVNVLDLEENAHVSRNFDEVAREVEEPVLDLVTSVDKEMEERALASGSTNIFTRYLSFNRLLSDTAFPEDMTKTLKTISNAYQHPVDIEFTVNFCETGSYMINLLQCRPFQIQGVGVVNLPQESVKPSSIILKTKGPVIGQSMAKKIDHIIYIRPDIYSGLPTSKRYLAARIIGKITNHSELKGVQLLLGPGRWGSRMPELGIPVNFYEIRNVSILCEMTIMHEGLNTDLSLGTHFFNDLVDMNILYLGINQGMKEAVFSETIIDNFQDILPDILPDTSMPKGLIRVISTSKLSSPQNIYINADAQRQEALVFIK